MRRLHVGVLLLALTQLAACGTRLVGWPIADLTAPTVISTTPANAAVNVSFNTALTATFSEEMAPETISATTFTVYDGAMAVSGSVTTVGVTATFTPTFDLDPDTLYTATIAAGVTDLAGNAMVSDHVWTFTTGAGADTTPPTVIFTSPEAGATEVALNAAITATFSEPMTPLTISSVTFTVFDGPTAVPGAVMYAGVTAVFTPDVVLEPGTLYTATVTNAVTDLAGNAMVNDHVWTFTTGAFADVTAPWVVSTTPENGEIDVALNASITATFSEAMAPLTISGATFTVLDGVTPVPGTVTYAGLTAVFTPDDLLDPGTQYQGTITVGVTDLAGNAMAAPYTWTFTTGDFVDTTDPWVVSTTPENGELDVALNASITATFSEAMAPLTISQASFTLLDGLIPVPGQVTYAGLTAVFTPDSILDPATLYTAQISTGVTDLAGNAMAAPYTWSFTTGDFLDTTDPWVVSTTPENDEIDVALNASITATFSEVMDPLTISQASFTLVDGVVPVPGQVTYAGLTAVFTPDSILDPATLYRGTITLAVTDLAGNAMAAPYTWTFTTGDFLDGTPPWVVSTTPLDDATDVPLNTPITATFSELMDPMTISDLTFTLYDGATPVLGSVMYAGLTATFTPDLSLDASTLYTAMITNAVTDEAGNAMVADHVWLFTTEEVVDASPPMVIATTPLSDASDVPVNTPITATFSEAMDPLTINDLTFTLYDGMVQVPGTVVYAGLTAIFSPMDPLDASTLYTATVTNQVEDLAGNAMVSDYVWEFTTESISYALNPVNLRSLESFVAVAGAGLTNSNSSGITVLGGDVGLYPTATCLGDGVPCTATNPTILGTLYAADPGGIAAQAKVDLTAAYVDAMGRPPGTTVNDISGMTLPPGVYTSGSTMSIAVGGMVVLDGQGDPNAVWIFQIGSSLTVNNNAQVLLINGAKAKNVFWAAFASTTLGSQVNFAGNVLAGASNSVGTDSTVLGRLLCITGQITLLSNTITLPL